MWPRDGWYPTKFERVGESWRSSRKAVPISSRLMADLVVAGYEKAIREHARGDLVDLGCGNAPLAGIYGPLVKSCLWVDWQNTLHTAFRLDVEANLNEPLPLESGSFDTVILTDVLEHLQRPELLLSEVFRILRPGGKAIIGVPFLYSLHEEPYDYYRYTRHKLLAFGEEFGFETVSLSEVGGPLDVIHDIGCKILVRIPVVVQLYYYGTRALRTVLSSLNQKAARRFPMAYVAVFARPGETAAAAPAATPS
jgi:SAM-dependent methyltransferase